MEITNIALQKVDISEGAALAKDFKNSLESKMGFDVVMENLKCQSKTEQPIKNKAENKNTFSGNKPKVADESEVKENVDGAEMFLEEEPEVPKELMDNAESPEESKDALEEKQDEASIQGNVTPLVDSSVFCQNTQNSENVESKEPCVVPKLVSSPMSDDKMPEEPKPLMAKMPEDTQDDARLEKLVPAQEFKLEFAIDEVSAYKNANSAQPEDSAQVQLMNAKMVNNADHQFENSSEVVKFAQDSDLEIQVEPQPFDVEQTVATQTEKLVHNVWQNENDIADLEVGQQWALSAETKKPDGNLLEHKELELEPGPKVSVEQVESLTISDEPTASGDENSSDLAGSGEDFGPYAASQNVQELNKTNDGYYDVKTAKVVTKQIAFSIEKAIAEIENNQPVKIQMSLTPKELGTLVINFVVEEGKIASLTIAASNQHTKELIDKNMVMLQQELDKSGFEVKTVEVFSAGANNSGNSTESGQHENQERQQEAYEHLLQKDFKHEFAANLSK